MATIRLTKEIETRLAFLTEKSGRTKSFHIRQAIEEYLDEMEDVYLAEERFRTLKTTIPLDDIISPGSMP